MLTFLQPIRLRHKIDSPIMLRQADSLFSFDIKLNKTRRLKMVGYNFMNIIQIINNSSILFIRCTVHFVTTSITSIKSLMLYVKVCDYRAHRAPASIVTDHTMMSWNLTSKKCSTETEYGVWKLLSCSFTYQSKKIRFRSPCEKDHKTLLSKVKSLNG